VPVRVADGDGTRLDSVDRDGYRVQRYRPRVEGLFARIERWRHRTTGDTHWRAITRDNVLSIYGLQRRRAERRQGAPRAHLLVAARGDPR
jgi:Salmonella virulence plasmid 65kDa B protein